MTSGIGELNIWYNTSMSFSNNLFWDADPEMLDYDANRRYVIERVLNRGTLTDLKEAFSYYGRDVIREVAVSLRSLEPKALSFISCVLSIPRENFRCYTRKQYSKAPWIF